MPFWELFRFLHIEAQTFGKQKDIHFQGSFKNTKIKAVPNLPTIRWVKRCICGWKSDLTAFASKLGEKSSGSARSSASIGGFGDRWRCGGGTCFSWSCEGVKRWDLHGGAMNFSLSFWRTSVGVKLHIRSHEMRGTFSCFLFLLYLSTSAPLMVYFGYLSLLGDLTRWRMQRNCKGTQNEERTHRISPRIITMKNPANFHLFIGIMKSPISWESQNLEAWYWRIDFLFFVDSYANFPGLNSEMFCPTYWDVPARKWSDQWLGSPCETSSTCRD